MQTLQKAALRLFNAIVTEQPQDSIVVTPRTLQRGYIVAGTDPAPDLLAIIDETVGLSAEQANSSFHKSWATVRDASETQLLVQQVLHYLSTYGLEALGINNGPVYVPHEELDVPGVSDDLPLTVVRALTPKDVLARCAALGSGVALDERVQQDIVTLVEALGADESWLAGVGNFELRARLYKELDTVPADPVAWLRYAVFRLTGETLLIKNQALLAQLEEADEQILRELVAAAPDDLAAIFYRFKPLFLAMKRATDDPDTRRFINRLRRLAPHLHQPVHPDYLSRVTQELAQGTFDSKYLHNALQHATFQRKVRLLNALRYRLAHPTSIVRRVRNGRVWAEPFAWAAPDEPTRAAHGAVFASLCQHVTVDTPVYIPHGVHYTVPATQKAFLGTFPDGTTFSLGSGLIFGVHWTDVGRTRIDLDLSLVSSRGKIGWDGEYRSEERDILFSGDMTAAPPPDGASELFYVQGVKTPQLVNLNYYNYRRDTPVTATLFIAHVPNCCELAQQKYIVHLDAVLARTKFTIQGKQKVLGLVCGGKFTVINGEFGTSITASDSEPAAHIREYLRVRARTMLTFDELLTAAGTTIVRTYTDDCIDLSPESVSVDTLLRLFD